MRSRLVVAGFLAGAALAASAWAAEDAQNEPLTGVPGDAARGRAVVLSRTLGNCLLCHALPVPTERFQGDIGPSLAGVGSRLSAGQMRYRIVDSTRLNPDTIMPAYHRAEGAVRVAGPFRGRPVLTAQEVEDVVAYLLTLRE
ncbi:MAG: sulfur oxidation c-type cytochrome SoxX [Alphaproteobacteria bacterium]|nr:sulfur oxidation c-type cytochrome SoxX [Alphaproteobacteria bacterium]